MEFMPLGKRVLLKRQAKEEKTQSGIILQGSSSGEKPSCGVIKSISGEVTSKDLSVGLTVFFKEYKANEIKLNNEEFLVVEVEDILGVLKK